MSSVKMSKAKPSAQSKFQKHTFTASAGGPMKIWPIAAKRKSLQHRLHPILMNILYSSKIIIQRLKGTSVNAEVLDIITLESPLRTGKVAEFIENCLGITLKEDPTDYISQSKILFK